MRSLGISVGCRVQVLGPDLGEEVVISDDEFGLLGVGFRL